MFRLWGGNDDQVYYDMLHRQAALNRAAAEEMRALADDFERAAKHISKLEQLLSDAQQLVTSIIKRTSAAFLTPLDKEDLEALALAQGRVPRWLLQAALRISYYKVPEPRPELAVLSDLVLDMARNTEGALAHLSQPAKYADLRQLLTKIVRLRLESDRSFLQAVGAWLNEAGTDPLLSIKWRDIYTSIETAQTRFLTVAEHIELILAKYS
jgi:uncharacterized protein Yka (UPF0111/DUF47 family)